MRRPGEDVATFLARGSDDAGCRWLCETAGHRTAAQESGIGQAVDRMAPGLVTPAKLLPTPQDMIRRVS